MDEKKLLETAEKYKTWFKWGGAAAIIFILTPLIMTLVKSVIAIGVLAVVGLFAINTWPAAAEWFRQWKYNALKRVIEANPVLAHLGVMQERQKDLDENGALLQEQIEEIENAKRAIEGLIPYPDQHKKMLDQIHDWEQLLAYRVDEYKQAKESMLLQWANHKKLEICYEVDKKMAKAGQKINAAMSSLTQFVESESFKAVDRMNAKAVAALRMSIIDKDFAKEQIAKRDKPLHAVSYNPDGSVKLGNILKPIDVEAIVVEAPKEAQA